MKQGPVAERIILHCYANNLPLPAKFADPPVVQEGLELFMSAFYSCSSERSFGTSVGVIPDSAIRTWLRDNGLDDDWEVVEDMLTVVRQIDNAYVEVVNKKKPDRTPKGADDGERSGKLRPKNASLRGQSRHTSKRREESRGD